MSHITVRIPEDGGNPRDPSRIRVRKDGSIHIDPEHEPWLPLTHPLARMETVLVNRGPDVESVDVEIDLDPDGTQDLKPAWDLAARAYLYTKGPSGWRRVDGRMEGHVLHAHLDLPPGETPVGLSPCFGIEDERARIAALPDDGRVRKECWTRSAEGREVWMLTVTDPAVPDEEKMDVLLLGREHAYETFSSFAIGGMLDWLLSGDPAANLDRIVYRIIPLANPDAVYHGWMYTAPQPDPVRERILAYRHTELFPDVDIRLHNWVNTHFDDVRYNHADRDGRRIREAWDGFTRYFPAESEYGRDFSVNEDGSGNWQTYHIEPHLHAKQYRLDAYRRRHGHEPHVWTGEIPWFGRDDIDAAQRARETGVKFLHAIVQTELRLLNVPNAVLVPGRRSRVLRDLPLLASGPRRGSWPPRILRWDRGSFGGGLHLQGVDYARGCSMIPGMKAEWRLPDEKFDQFEAMAGLDDHGCAAEDDIAVEFIVLLDDRIAWSSGPMRPRERRRVEVPLAGAKRLGLVALVCDGDAAAAPDALEARVDRMALVSADWADAKLTSGGWPEFAEGKGGKEKR